MNFLTLFIITFGFSTFSFAQNYDLNLKLSLNGKHISSPRLVVKAGEKATVTQQANGGSTFIDVIASEPTDSKVDAVHLKFSVGTIDQKGERTVLSTPQVTSKIGESAQIRVGKPGKTPDLELTVTAKRVK